MQLIFFVNFAYTNAHVIRLAQISIDITINCIYIIENMWK
jgi:hypothetical protein